MRAILSSVLLAAVLARSGTAGDDPATDRKKIEGDWKVVSIEDGGRAAPEGNVRGVRWVFSTDRIVAKRGEKILDMQFRYRIDSSRSPRTIDLIELHQGKEGRTMLGIYELRGDDLKLCFPEGHPGQRSTAFESKPDSVNDMLIRFKRLNP